MRRAKIVCTMGPAVESPEKVKELIEAGMNMARLNLSHGGYDEHQNRLDRVREAAKAAGQPVAILVDLQGPKIRLARFANGPHELERGDIFTITVDEVEGTKERVGTTYKGLPGDCKPGDRILIDDGKVTVEVVEVKGNDVVTKVIQPGAVSNNKGINLPGVAVSVPALSEKDKEDLLTAVGLGADYIAISFPKNAEDMKIARELSNQASQKFGHKAKLIAKIERAEAVLPGILEGILEVSDGIMVARGDLAVEVGNATVPALQKKMIQLAREANKVVITATQMMESMIVNPVPTRAEVSDVANAVLDGTDAVMLSAETASGQYPVETVLQMAAICKEAEKTEVHHLDADFFDQKFTRIDQSIAFGALFTAYHLGVKAIVALTDSGSTALWMSRHKIQVPIFALTTKVASQRAMALYRNVHPQQLETSDDRDTALNQAESCVKDLGVVQSGDAIVLTVGEPMGTVGGTNTLKIVNVK